MLKKKAETEIDWEWTANIKGIGRQSEQCVSQIKKRFYHWKWTQAKGSNQILAFFKIKWWKNQHWNLMKNSTHENEFPENKISS